MFQESIISLLNLSNFLSGNGNLMKRQEKTNFLRLPYRMEANSPNKKLEQQ